jgi:hypothetical protein
MSPIERHPVRIARTEEADATSLERLLVPVVARLSHALQVARVEEQPTVTSVRLLVIDERCLQASLVAVRTLAVRVRGEPALAQRPPFPRAIPLLSSLASLATLLTAVTSSS